MRRERWFLVGLLLLLLVACTDTGTIPDGGGGDGKITVVPLREPSESQTGRFEFTNTSSEAVSFEIITTENTRDGEPIAQWFDIAPQQGTIPAGESIIVTLTTDEDFSQPGFYSSRLIVKYPGGETRFSATAQLGDSTGPNINLSETSLTLERGETSDPIIISVSGFDGEVTLSAKRGDDGLPPDQIEVVDPPKTPIPNGSSTSLTLRPFDDAAAGTYEIIITGKSGSQTASRVFSVTVPGSGGGGEEASISGSVHTDNFLGNFIVPSSLGAQNLTVQGDRPDYVSGQLLVQFKNTGLATTANSAELYNSLSQAVRADYELRVLEAGSFNEPALIAIPEGQSVEEATARLSADPRVVYAEPNYYIYPMSIPNDPKIDQLWNMAVSGVPVAWGARDSAPSVVVAVVDAGIALGHPDLQNVFVSGGYDFCASNGCSSSDNDVRPDSSSDVHGTHVTGTIAAVGNNNRGVAGVLQSGASILPVKVFYDYRASPLSAIIDAIRWAAGIDIGGVPDNDHPADIINLSLGFEIEDQSELSQAFREAVKDAQSEGALLIAAAGNSGASGVIEPASYPGVIGVGSVNSSFKLSCFSNYGEGLDVVAAGGDGFICPAPRDESILSTFPNGTYGMLVGTSQAAPVVSGVAALIWEGMSNPTADRVADALLDRAYDLGSVNQYGAGLVRADVALGFPGPGDGATVTTSGGVDTVELNLQGGSSLYVIDGLSAGTYTLTAEAQGDGRNLSGSREASLNAGQSLTKIEIEVD